MRKTAKQMPHETQKHKKQYRRLLISDLYRNAAYLRLQDARSRKQTCMFFAASQPARITSTIEKTKKKKNTSVYLLHHDHFCKHRVSSAVFLTECLECTFSDAPCTIDIVSTSAAAHRHASTTQRDRAGTPPNDRGSRRAAPRIQPGEEKRLW